MLLNPVEAEAVGQEFITSTFRGATFRVPLDVDSWPVDLIRRSRGVKAEEIVPNPAVLMAALKGLLQGQWPDLLEVAPKRKHLTEASNTFAAAVGIPADIDTDVVFGAIPRLLLTIDTWPGKVESDLEQFWGIDYGHRFLFQAGRRRLTLRKIHARLQNLPTDSAVAIAMNGGHLHKSGTELVLMDLYERMTGTRHPSRPMSAAELAAREAEKAQEDAARSAYRARMDKQNPRLAGMELARANAQEAQGR